MKLALVGYGKMGRAVEKVALEKGHDVVARIDPLLDTPHIDADALAGATRSAARGRTGSTIATGARTGSKSATSP